jgi:hypothetical protein
MYPVPPLVLLDICVYLVYAGIVALEISDGVFDQLLIINSLYIFIVMIILLVYSLALTLLHI